MTSRVICTEAQIRRAVRAAQKEGLQIAGMRPDGTLIFGEPPNLAPGTSEDFWLDPSKWKKPGTE